MLSLLIVAGIDQMTGAGPVRTEMVAPLHLDSFNQGGRAKKRVQGGHPRLVDGNLVFDGSSDGDRQVDPQIAVGGGFVLHGTNGGLVIYDKAGNYVDGVPQTTFNDGIDPKLFYDPHNHVFGFDMWVYWDKAKVKPVNVSISETSDPRGAWNTYPVPSRAEVDGGSIGFSRSWIGYTYPGGSEGTFLMKMADAKAGRPVKVYHFAGSFGQPVFTQDPVDDLTFVDLTDQDIVLTTVGADPTGDPVVRSVVRAPHHFSHFGWPPPAPMRGTTAKTAAGDRNPKNAVRQSNSIWFCQTVDIDGRAGVVWHQVRMDGKFLQDGMIASPNTSYIQSTLAVNRRRDVLVGFQETGSEMEISPRAAWRRAGDRSGVLGPIWRIAEGLAPTAGGPWGDYSGSVVDGDNMIDLWTIQSIADARGHGSTIIARIRP